MVERARTARRYISATKPPYAISDLNIIELDKNSDVLSDSIKSLMESKISFGLISESGMPAIADPGSDIVSIAHDFGYKIIPLVGPSSIFLSLAASGLSGQSFCFRGYLPIKDNELNTCLKQLEKRIQETGETQIFIETPYRNERLYKAITNKVSGHIKLCIAADLTGNEEFIRTKTVKRWKASSAPISKIPTIFLLGR